MRIAVAVVVSSLLAGIGFPGVVVAEDVESELKELRERVQALEEGRPVGQPGSSDGPGDRPQAIRAMGPTTITGGLTMILQGASSSQLDPASSADASFSLDLFFEREISPSGLVWIYLDAQQGKGLASVPMFTGPNADVEVSSGSQIKLHEAWYKHNWREDKVILTVGKFDPTLFFDANAYANDERSQFLAVPLVNNPALAFGGDADGFVFGAALQVRPFHGVEAAFGWQEGNGDFEDVTSRPFTIAELAVEGRLGERVGRYRIYSWANGTLEPSYLGGPDTDNRGIGLSFDQEIVEHVGAWVRFGSQNGEIAPFDRVMAAGVDIKGTLFNRRGDGIGVGYAQLRISGDYSAVSGLDANETYWEAYYRLGISRVTLTPDVQLVTNAGGDGSLDPIWIWGLRFQVYF